MPVAVLEGPTMRFQLQQMTLSEKQRKAKVNGTGGPRPLFCVLDSAQSQQLPDKSPAALKEVGQSMLEGVGLSLPSTILEAQNHGMALVQQTGSQGSLDFWIRSLMFDESTFSLSLQHEAANCHLGLVFTWALDLWLYSLLL